MCLLGLGIRESQKNTKYFLCHGKLIHEYIKVLLVGDC